MRIPQSFNRTVSSIIKVILILACVISLFNCSTIADARIVDDPYEPVYTTVKTEESEIFIWNELSKYSPNDQITAGVMGFFWKESGLRSDAVAGWIHRNVFRNGKTDICVEFMTEVDAGIKDGSSRDYFIEEVRIFFGGYGLGQWVDIQYLEDFYDFIQERGGSIGDAALQCEFVFYSMQKNEKLWNSLLECKTPVQCGRRIGIMYDGTCAEHAEFIASIADEYYKKFHIE